jgi:hypothetical protein
LKGEIMLTKEQRLRRATIAVVAPLYHEPLPIEATERADALERWHEATAPETNRAESSEPLPRE